MNESVKLKEEPFLLWFFPSLVELLLQLPLFTNVLPLLFLRRGVIPTVMCSFGYTASCVFHSFIWQWCVCRVQDLAITDIIWWILLFIWPVLRAVLNLND